MSVIELKDITMSYGPNRILEHFNLSVEQGTFLTMIGSSGCGKTTTLNMISGILPVSGGSIFFDDRDVTSLPPEKRGIGLVFQNYALYPHMTVLQNICFPMEI